MPLFKIILAIALLFLISCSGYDREEFRMEVGKKYALKKWPDSAYIDTLDRFFETEPVKPQRKQKAEISMSMNNKVARPSEKKIKEAPKKTEEGKESRETKDSKETKSFPDQFFEALERLSENPNSKEFGARHKAKGGETLDGLLMRVYGAKAKRIPKYLSEDMLKRLNPGVDFSSLSEGETVLLPNVK